MEQTLFKDSFGGESLDDIYREVLEKGQKAFPDRVFIFGDGNPSSKVVLIGESPGLPDAEFNKPFKGPVGDLLDRILASIGLNRQRVYLTNVVKFICDASEVTPEILKFFKPFLFREILAINPVLVVTLGNTPTQVLLNTKEKISKLRGQFYDFQGIKVMPTFNPAYLLRDASKKREVWEDMKAIKTFLQSRGIL